MFFKKLIARLLSIKMIESEPVQLKNGTKLPAEFIGFLEVLLKNIQNNRPNDFGNIQTILKKKELNRQEREALITSIFGNEAVDRAYGNSGFDSLIEKLSEALRCFIDEEGNLVDPRQ